MTRRPGGRGGRIDRAGAVPTRPAVVHGIAMDLDERGVLEGIEGVDRTAVDVPRASTAGDGSGFPNRLGDGANVYLTSAELAAVGAVLGKLPSPAEYMEYAKDLNSMSKEIYKYLNFDQMENYTKKAAEANVA